MKTLTLIVLLVAAGLIGGCNSGSEPSTKEKVVPPWEGPKSAARAAKDQVEASGHEVDRQLSEMDDDTGEEDAE